MNCAGTLLSVFAITLSTTAMAEISPRDRDAIDRILGRQGTYVQAEGAYKVAFPREEATIVQDYQTLSPNIGLNSWAAFSGAVHNEALLTGQFLLLGDEANAVLAVALDVGFEVTGLSASALLDGPSLYTLDLNGRGTYQSLATAFRKCLAEIHEVRRKFAIGEKKCFRPSVPLESAIDSRPLDAILSMRGTVVGGVYRAAIGKRAIIRGELVGREMGMATWFSLSGTNDHALAHGEFVETTEDLQKVLKALQSKGIKIDSIRNHALGEHPQLVFVRFWGEGSAVELAKAMRYALDVETGALPVPQART